MPSTVLAQIRHLLSFLVNPGNGSTASLTSQPQTWVTLGSSFFTFCDYLLTKSSSSTHKYPLSSFPTYIPSATAQTWAFLTDHSVPDNYLLEMPLVEPAAFLYHIVQIPYPVVQGMSQAGSFTLPETLLPPLSPSTPPGTVPLHKLLEMPGMGPHAHLLPPLCPTAFADVSLWSPPLPLCGLGTPCIVPLQQPSLTSVRTSSQHTAWLPLCPWPSLSFPQGKALPLAHAGVPSISTEPRVNHSSGVSGWLVGSSGLGDPSKNLTTWGNCQFKNILL